MLINRKQLIDLFLSDAEDVSPEYVSKMKKTMLKKLSRYSSIDLIEQAKRQWNWNLAIARSNTFLLNL